MTPNDQRLADREACLLALVLLARMRPRWRPYLASVARELFDFEGADIFDAVWAAASTRALPALLPHLTRALAETTGDFPARVQ
jgi:hypothetical protein